MKPRLSQQLKILSALYPTAHCELIFNNPFELLIATILSAQSTDKQVNKITATLFKTLPTPAAFVDAGVEKLSTLIRSLGLFRSKSKHIIQTCQILIDQHNGEVPNDRDQLEKLPGVGRKTAGVVLYNAFGVPAIPVDTHVQRIANRLGIAQSTNPLITETQLAELLPQESWGPVHHQLIWHGRKICLAKKPKCTECPLNKICSYSEAKESPQSISDHPQLNKDE